jgi:hypothetical protein
MLFVLSASCAFATASFAQTVRNAQIVSVTPGGVGYVTTSSGTTGLSAQIGRWDTPYPYAATGAPAPGLEPYGASTLTVAIDVNDGGMVSFRLGTSLSRMPSGKCESRLISRPGKAGEALVLNPTSSVHDGVRVE